MLSPLLFKRLWICNLRNLVKAKDNFTDIQEQSGCDEKDENASEEVTPAKYFIIMEISEILQNIDTAKGKMLLADPKGGVCKFTKAQERCLRHPVTWPEEKASTLLNYIWYIFYKEIKTLILNVSKNLNYSVLNEYSLHNLFICLHVFNHQKKSFQSFENCWKGDNYISPINY